MGQEWGRDPPKRGGGGGGGSSQKKGGDNFADQTLRGVWRRGWFMLGYAVRTWWAAPGWAAMLTYHRSCQTGCELCQHHPERSATGRAQALGFPRGAPLLARHTWAWIKRSPQAA